jgi:CHAT domain-containing protein
VAARNAPSSKAGATFFGFGDPVIQANAEAYANVKPEDAQLGPVDVCADIREGLSELHALPGSGEEIVQIAHELGGSGSKYLLGQEFTDVAVEGLGEQLANYKVIYFSTHGVLLPPSNGCIKPSLVTSLGPSPSSGLIDTDGIVKLDLDAEVVVLAACDTGRSAGNDPDALGGFVASFVEAGARNAVVSNWQAATKTVVDGAPMDPTEQLMTTMFADKGVSQADALAAAQRAMIARGDLLSHPFYWASFMVVGDGARSMPS